MGRTGRYLLMDRLNLKNNQLKIKTLGTILIVLKKSMEYALVFIKKTEISQQTRN